MPSNILRLLRHRLWPPVYETEKMLRVHDTCLALLYYAVSVGIFIAFVWYVIVECGYQDFDPVVSGVAIKVKGSLLVNSTVWDAADVVVPSQDNNAFFVTTNVVTVEQTRGLCPEDQRLSSCSSDADCPSGLAPSRGNGVFTGRCVATSQLSGNRSCELQAWCPLLESGALPTASAFGGVTNFTVLIKNNVLFPRFSVVRRNWRDDLVQLDRCLFDPDDAVNKYCPVFRIGDILMNAGVGKFDDIGILGGMIGVRINWTCSFDWNTDCQPGYSFSRMDDASAKQGAGWNFMHSSSYRVPDNSTLASGWQEWRSLSKLYGIRFVVLANGRAGKADTVVIMKAAGSFIGLVSIAALICNAILRYCSDQAKWKYEETDSSASTVNDASTGVVATIQARINRIAGDSQYEHFGDSPPITNNSSHTTPV